MKHRSQSEAGFSLLELMIAMLMTLIVSGAIYGLLAAGQTAFRREPEVAELTQNVRTAMAMIQRDVESAGVGFSTLTQVFTDGLNNDAAAADAQLSVVAGNDGQFADGLELLTSDELCPGVTVCKVEAGGAGNIVDVAVDIPQCMREPPGRLMGFISAKGLEQPAFFVGSPVSITPSPGALACTALPPLPPGGAPLGVQFDLPNGSGPVEWRPPNAFPAPPGTPASIGPVRVISYRVALSGDPQDPAPCLWRSETGGRVGPGYAAPTDPPSAAWQLVARGVEDMQVQYLRGDAAAPPNDFVDVPGVIPVPPPGVPAAPPLVDLIRRVRVTLSARSTAPNLQGLMPAAANVAAVPNAMRVQMTAEMSPRAALLSLQQVGDWN